MNVKKSSFAIALGLCFGLLGTNTAYSSEITVEGNDDDIVISQLRGHDTYDGGEQIQWDGHSLGRVISKSGNIMTIKAEDGTVFHANGSVSTGSDVLVGVDENDNYYVVHAAHSEWISHLEADYGWKRTTMSNQALNERTAAIWAEIEAGSSQTVTQSLDRQTTTSIEVEQEVETTSEFAPVRGLW
jgi:hypothetical protein